MSIAAASLPRIPQVPVRASSAPVPSATTSAAERDRGDDITIGQALSGLAGAVVGATILTVGNTASSLVRVPQGVFESYRSLWKTEALGPILKTALAVTVP